MKKMVRSLIPVACLLFIANFAMSATYYIRPDGGTAGQCNGALDAAYPGSGTGQICAWAHPFWALDSSGNWRIQGGDTLFIHSGSYQMGFGAPNTGWCSTDSAWDCHLPALPSGPASQNPTRLLGVGWNSGCPNPPELWGTQRTNHVLDLNGTGNAAIECLEITDRSGCVESHTNTSVACQRDNYPYGDWAPRGIFAADSTNVTLRHLNIHGLAHTGILAGRLMDWLVEDVRIAGNGMAGWDGDLPDGLDANNGTLTFRRLTVEWNGCAESYPDRQPNNCWAQTAGGYGDGFGQGGRTGGHWIIEDSVFRYNTSDGIDMLYVRENSQIEIRRTKSYGNAGDQIKVNGPTRIENSLMVSNCGYFNGKDFTYNVDNCRAGGSALVFVMRQGNTVSVVNSTLAGQGDCLLIAECDDTSCNGSENVIVQNNIFQGFQEFNDPTDTTCYVWFDQNNFYNTQMDYNVIYNVKTGSYPLGPHDLQQNPLFVNASLDTFDGHLQSGSPAINSGLPVASLNGLVPFNDLTGALRPCGSGVDRGTYEYGATLSGLNPNPPEHAVRLIFIHHSTGENWLADENGGLGSALRDNNYFVSDTNYGWGPVSIGDTTDIGHWWLWFRGPSSSTYLSALYNEGGQHAVYARLPTAPIGENEIITFKSCFPNSALQGNPGDAVPLISNNLLRGESSGSEHHTVANAKGIYIDLLEYFRTRQDKLFIAVTAPPLSDPTYGSNARAFNQWLVNDWLVGYPYKNVFVFDFYNVLTTNGGNANTNDLYQETGNHHRWWNNGIQHKTDGDTDGDPNILEYPSGDDHPSRAGNLKATGEFLSLLNIAYHRWKGWAGIPGDHNGDGQTTIDELQRAINQFLGVFTAEPCNDLNGDGQVTIDELQQVINAFLGIVP